MSLGFRSAGNQCCAVGCTHKSSKTECSFFSFPADNHWRKVWIAAVNRAAVDENGKPIHGKLWQPKKHHRLCSCHFSSPPCVKNRQLGWNHVKPDIFPSKKVVRGRPGRRKVEGEAKPADQQVHLQGTVPVHSTDGQSCTPINSAVDCNQDINEVIVLQNTPDVVDHDHDYTETKRGGRLACAIDSLVEKHLEFLDFRKDYEGAKEMETKLDSLEKSGQILSLSIIKECDSLFQYYTSLPSYSVFKALFSYLEPKAMDMQYVSQIGKPHFTVRNHLKPGPSRLLSLEEEMFMTLVRLRLGVPSKDCARRFGISESLFSNVFNTWCILLSIELEKICVTPSSDRMNDFKPNCFDNFPNTRIVLDCTELFSQVPGTLESHKQQYSNYKHHSTVKFLIGMTPSGAISYVSDMWGGRASDKKITSECIGLLDSLNPGDKVMVDRGFTIAEDLPRGVKLIIPPFKNRVTGQFTSEQLHYSEKISAARIHVERAMRAIKEFRILEMEVRLAMINNYENIFKSCAFLVNFKRPFLKIR